MKLHKLLRMNWKELKATNNSIFMGRLISTTSINLTISNYLYQLKDCKNLKNKISILPIIKNCHCIKNIGKEKCYGFFCKDTNFILYEKNVIFNKLLRCMNYLEFEKSLKTFPVFSVKDIQKRFPNFDNRRLVEWQQKGYLVKIKRGYYCFSERNRGEQFLQFAANKIYSPSYISFESALSYYNLIPEGVFTVTSATTKNTANHTSPIGNFDYKHVKSNLFFGYKLMKEKDFTIKIAEPEKVLLDFFYINKINDPEEIVELRFNEIVAKEIIRFDKLKTYQQVFNSKILDNRIKMLIKVINA